MSLDIRELKVNDKVAILRKSYEFYADTQGVYTVAKADKVKIVLKRDSDGYERKWSVRHDEEMGRSSGSSKWSLELGTVAEHEEIQKRNKARSEIQSIWYKVEEATKRQSLVQVKELIAELEELKALVD